MGLWPEVVPEDFLEAVHPAEVEDVLDVEVVHLEVDLGGVGLGLLHADGDGEQGGGEGVPVRGHHLQGEDHYTAPRCTPLPRTWRRVAPGRGGVP